MLRVALKAVFRAGLNPVHPGPLWLGAVGLILCLPTMCLCDPAKLVSSLPDLDLVLISPRTFLMGSPKTEWGHRPEEQQRQVTLSRSFYLATTEVTQRQWQTVMGSNPSYLYDCPDCPVENVSWYDAIEFCNRLSAMEDLLPIYTVIDTNVNWDDTANGYRLPTEAEWEYSCRARTTTPFYTGNCLSASDANFNGYLHPRECPLGLSREQVVDVGSFAPNTWGLFDMHGNVAEWCWDWLNLPTPDPAIDPRGPEHGELKIIRGGNYAKGPHACRSASRMVYDPHQKNPSLGLRLARSSP
jgi:formylglycine-generating enzyme required for sulfatase activity